MKKLIKEYLEISIKAKKSLIKEISIIHKLVKQLYEIVADMNVLMEEFKDESYKTKFKEEHRKFKDYEKESKQIIDELTNELKKAGGKNGK